MEDYFKIIKEKMKDKIPAYGTSNFDKLRNKIKNDLKKKEIDYLILTRSLKILLLGDWFNEEKKQKLSDMKKALLKSGLYAETIDNYYNIKKKGGLTQHQILEKCCIDHQLIVLLDGEGKGTLTEQNYLALNYPFHKKVLFFIEENKFGKLKDNPSEYIKDFPTIIVYPVCKMAEIIVIFSKFRIYRLADIILRQSGTGRGLKSPKYVSWKNRLFRRKKRY